MKALGGFRGRLRRVPIDRIAPCKSDTYLRALVLDQGVGVWGAQRYLLRLYPLLLERGVELTLGSPPTELRQTWTRLGYPSIEISLPVARSIRTEGRLDAAKAVREARLLAQTPRTIAAAMRTGGFDVLVANSHWTHLDSAIASRLTGKPGVLHLHETSVAGVGSRLRDVAIISATKSVAVSNSVAASTGALPRRKVAVITNGVDLRSHCPAEAREIRDLLRSAFGFHPDEVVLFAATRLDPSKHIEDLVELSRRLPQHARVVVAGTTSEYPGYEQRVRELARSLPDAAVTFLGNRDDVPTLLQASDVFVHTGLIEGMPLGVVEAQASGLPVVAYDAAGVREAVRDRSSGYVVPRGDIDALTRAATALVTSHSLRSQFGLAARDFAKSTHRIDIQADRNAHLLFEVCGREPWSG